MYRKGLKNGTETHICTLIFTPALFTLVNRWKHTNSPGTEDSINTLSIHTVEYDPDFKTR